jgi:DNA polymerase-1
VNFGFIYGASAYTFQKVALMDYGINFSMEECTKFRKSFFSDHTGLPLWYEKQEREALRNGYVENPIGRRRRLPNIKIDPNRGKSESQKFQEAVRMAVNAPVQSFGSGDLKLMSLLGVDKLLNPEHAFLIGEVHDSIVLQVREDKVNEVGRMILEIMAHPPLLDKFGVVLTVPIKAELKVGPSLGEAKEYAPK